jgi:hypothetical protein
MVKLRKVRGWAQTIGVAALCLGCGTGHCTEVAVNQPSAAAAWAPSVIHSASKGRLRAALSESSIESWALMVLWQVDESSQGELTELEREDVINTVEVAARDRLLRIGDPTLRLEVLVKEVWRPHRLFNMLMFALPIPGSGPLLAARGGIGLTFRVVDLKTRAELAEFSCRRRAGIDSLAGLLGRAADAKAAARSCVAQAIQALETGVAPPAFVWPTESTEAPVQDMR